MIIADEVNPKLADRGRWFSIPRIDAPPVKLFDPYIAKDGEKLNPAIFWQGALTHSAINDLIEKQFALHGQSLVCHCDNWAEAENTPAVFSFERRGEIDGYWNTGDATLSLRFVDSQNNENKGYLWGSLNPEKGMAEIGIRLSASLFREVALPLFQKTAVSPPTLPEAENIFAQIETLDL